LLRRFAPRNDERSRLGLAAIGHGTVSKPALQRLRQPDGQISLSSPFCKNILIFRNRKSLYSQPRPVPSEGRLAIVTNAGQDAVDAKALLTNGADADGKIVWS
jgi:hypothetical protein